MSIGAITKRADAQFSKLPGAEDANDAQPEHEAAADALAAKIARLKELRLARDAAVLAAPPSVKVKKVRGKKKLPAVSAAVSLSNWLKSRHVGGSSG